jgi:hypothetical protein
MKGFPQRNKNKKNEVSQKKIRQAEKKHKTGFLFVKGRRRELGALDAGHISPVLISRDELGRGAFGGAANGGKQVVVDNLPTPPSTRVAHQKERERKKKPPS